jgi:hypothetical protein
MSKKMAAMSPPFPHKRGAKKGSKQVPGGKSKVQTKTSVDPNIEGYTPKGAMKGGGSTTATSGRREKQARAKRLADIPM